MGPEFIMYRKSSVKSDVWSFGVLMWETLSFGSSPYGKMDRNEVFQFLEAGNRLAKPENLTVDISSYYNIMVKCWEWEPENRPTFTELIQLISFDSLTATVRDLGKMVSETRRKSISL